MMQLFGSKSKSAPPPQPQPGAGVPTNLVIQMRTQNFSDNQIVQSLQRDGYSANQIFDAMNQADLQMQGSIPEFGQPGPEMAPMPMPSMPPPMIPPPRGQQSEESMREKMEEIAEALIDEKWEEFVKNLNKVVEWKDRTEQRVAALDQAVKDLQGSFDNLHKAMIGKLGEYDQNIVNVGVEIKAMERVFQKVLPTLTDNINDLQRITKQMKESTPGSASSASVKKRLSE